MRAAFVTIMICLFLVGCVRQPHPAVPNDLPSYEVVDQAAAADLAGDLAPALDGVTSWVGLRESIEDNLAYIRRRPAASVCVNRPGLELTWGELRQSVEELLASLEDMDHDPTILAERFTWLKVTPRTLLTGYYEPWLRVSDEPDAKYRYPLYGVPDDLKMVDLGQFHPRWKGQKLVYRQGEDGIKPYFDRESIDAEGALDGQGYEIAWAKDPVDIFFLQIQGSGRLVYPDGSVRHILYGGKNGRQYVSLGRLLIERGEVPREEMSMQRIRQYFEENPETAKALMFENPSYVFFQIADQGPFGSIGSILRPRVSVAVDRTFIPLGSVLVLQTAFEDHAAGEIQPHTSLVLAQDTGGAIKGSRMDLFCGSGTEAELLAGHLQAESTAYLLVSKQVLEAATR